MTAPDTSPDAVNKVCNALAGLCVTHPHFAAPGQAMELLHQMSLALTAAEAANVCDACLGQPISGKPCMCGGTGKASDAVMYLRDELVKAQSALTASGDYVAELKEQLRTTNSRLSYVSHCGCDDDRSMTAEIIKNVRAILAKGETKPHVAQPRPEFMADAEGRN